MKNENYLKLFEMMNDYGEKKLLEIEEKEPNEKSLISGHIFLEIKEDRRKKLGKILSSLVDDNEAYNLSYDEYNKFFRLYFPKILHYKPYTYVSYAYNEVKNKLEALSDLNINVYVNID